MKVKINNKLLWTAFIMYLILLVWVIMFKAAIPEHILGHYYPRDPLGFNETIGKYMSYNLYERFVYDFTNKADSLSYQIQDGIENIIIFMPMGIYLSLLLSQPNGYKTSLIAFGISSFFELYQLFTAFGSFCFFDIINNVLGCVLGVSLYHFLIRHIKEKYIPKTVNYINVGVLIIFIPVVIYAFISVGLNFDVIMYRYAHVKY